MNKNIFLEKKYEINENTGINVSKRKLTRDFETHTHGFFEIEFILSGKALHTICFNSGFGSYPVFSRAFKKRYGCSPSDVRRT